MNEPTDGKRILSDLRDSEIDLLEERLQDVFFDDVEEFSKMNYSEVLDVDIELKRLFKNPEGDEEWNSLSPEAQRLMSSTRSEKTSKIYRRYFALYTKHAQEKGLEMFSELSCIDFMLWAKDKYGKGTLWSIYSCINHNFQCMKKTNLKSFTRLKIIMKRLTEGHVSRKAKVFLEAQIKEVLSSLDDENVYELADKIGISLLFYGMLRQNEVLQLEVQDMELHESDGEVVVKFPYATKTRDQGFEYFVPEKLRSSFVKYIGQLDPRKGPTTRFLKNWSVQGKRRVQNMGEKKVRELVKKACKILNIPDKNYTTHTFRRSAATILADNGVTMVNLKRHGRWSSDSVAEGYIDNSKKIKLERLLLLGDELSPHSIAVAKRPATETPSPSPKYSKSDGRTSIETTASTVVYHNCQMYSSGSMQFGVSTPPPPPPAPAQTDNMAFLSAIVNFGKTFMSNCADSEASPARRIEDGDHDANQNRKK